MFCMFASADRALGGDKTREPKISRKITQVTITCPKFLRGDHAKRCQSGRMTRCDLSEAGFWTTSCVPTMHSPILDRPSGSPLFDQVIPSVLLHETFASDGRMVR